MDMDTIQLDNSIIFSTPSNIITLIWIWAAPRNPPKMIHTWPRGEGWGDKDTADA